MVDPSARFEDLLQVDDLRLAVVENDREVGRFGGLDDPLDEGRGEPAQPGRLQGPGRGLSHDDAPSPGFAERESVLA